MPSVLTLLYSQLCLTRSSMGRTKEMIRRMIEFNPLLTNTEIVEATGLSRQLVSYHARTLKMPRQSANRSCSFCGLRITRYNASGLCRKCRPLAFTYEFQCAWCGEVYAVQGKEAANRRNSKKHKKNPDLDFCTLSCAQRYNHRQ